MDQRDERDIKKFIFLKKRKKKRHQEVTFQQICKWAGLRKLLECGASFFWFFKFFKQFESQGNSLHHEFSAVSSIKRSQGEPRAGKCIISVFLFALRRGALGPQRCLGREFFVSFNAFRSYPGFLRVQIKTLSDYWQL